MTDREEPPTVVVDDAAIPDELKERDQWLMWDASADAPRRPHWAGDFGVSWNDPEDWHSFDEAVELAQQRPSWGIGYVFAKDVDGHPRGIYGALDLDGVAAEDHASPKEWLPSLAPFMDADAYVEWSPSGRGLHIPLAGFSPPEWWRDVDVDEHEGVEAYGAKFFTFTGDTLDGAGEAVADTGEWVEEWLAEVYEAVNGEDPREQRGAVSAASSGPDGAESDYSGDEWIDRDTAEEMLSHIDAGCGYKKWRNIGFALRDHFSEGTARRLFESWSRGSSKWDSEAERFAKDIIENGDGSVNGGRVTVATLVYYAEDAGWEPSTDGARDKDSPTWKNIVAATHDEIDSPEEVPDDWRGFGVINATGRPDQSAEADADDVGDGSASADADEGSEDDSEPASADAEGEGAAADGGATVEAPIGSEETEGPPPLAPPGVISVAVGPRGRFDWDPVEDDPEDRPTVWDLRNEEAATYIWHILEERGEDDVIAVSDGSLRAYDGGVWTREGNAGEQRLREVGAAALGAAYSSSVLEQLKEETRHRNRYHVDSLGVREPYLVVGDQKVNLRTREAEPVVEEDLALRQINAEYDPEADEPELWLDFLTDVAAGPEAIKKVQEYFGYCLWVHGQPRGKALFLLGDTDSGKGTALRVLTSILGEEYIASEKLDDLADSRWGKAELYGRMANIRNEVTPGRVQGVEEFKELTGGGDRVSAEFKGEDKFRFTVTQKFIFATNQFPDVEGADRAFWNRCLFARFPDRIPPEEQVPDFHEELLAERSGILNWMIDGLERVLERGRFTGERSIEEKQNIAEEAGSVLERLKQDALEITGEPDHVVHADDMYELAKAYAEREDMTGDLPPWQGGAFTNAMKGWPQVDSSRSRKVAGPDEDRPSVYTGLAVDEDVADDLGVEVRTHLGVDAGQSSLDV